MELIKAQLNSSNVVTGCIVVSTSTEAGFEGVLVSSSLAGAVTAGWTYDGTNFLPPVPPQPTLPEALAAKLLEIKASRDAACYLPVTALARTWQAGARSQELLSSVINLCSSGLPLPATWRDLDDSDLAITSLTQLLAIAGAMAAQTQAAYGKSWQLKAAARAASTLTELEAVKW